MASIDLTREIRTVNKLIHLGQTLAALALICMAAPAAADPVPGMGTWQTTLQARDINGDGTVDAYYDTVANLTWLADANMILTTGWHAPPGGMPQPDALGRVTYFAASYWAPRLNVYGVTGWRLPTVQATMSCIPNLPHSCTGSIIPGTSELENLFRQTLGDNGGSVFNTGPFSNIQSGYYWTGTFDPAVSGSAPLFVYNGVTGWHTKYSQDTSIVYAWAVHDGDVAVAVPEPASVALLAGGLGLVAVWARRQARHKA